MKYIGPFLRINNLTMENIQGQLFHFAKESIKHITLSSRFGITTSMKNFKLKSLPNFDINTFKENSPLLCIYKKSSAKLIQHKDNYLWDESTFKKEVNISSNAYMTLCILYLADYYKSFENIDKNLYVLSPIYSQLAKLQLDFYSSYLRNEDGVFVDKKDISDDITNDFKFEDKNAKFKFSDQALMMNAFYNYSLICDEKDKDCYKNFSLDILNMLIEYRDEIYNCSLEENIKTCMTLNILNKNLESEEVRLLLIDLMDLIVSALESLNTDYSTLKIERICLSLINLILFEQNTKLTKYKFIEKELYNYLMELFDNETSVFLKDSTKKEVNYSCEEVFLYILSTILYCKSNEFEDDEIKIKEMYKRLVMNSGIALSWPDAPNLNSAERYLNFSLKSEDLMDEINFRPATIASPETTFLAPTFVKYVTYNRKKDTFSVDKSSFDSTRNINLFFYMIYLKM